MILSLRNCLIVLVSLICTDAVETSNDTLELVHVLFRHGMRNPEIINLYENDPHFNESNYPSGYGQLTITGKMQSYDLGTYLRQHYTGFLPEPYNVKLIQPRSSEFNRTKESLQVVLAGLFPPTPAEQFLDLNWQPIAYNYVERGRDKELFCFGCPNWDKEFNGYLASSEGKQILGRYAEVFETVSNYTGENITDFVKLYYLYFGFMIQEELKMELPEWTSLVYPQPLKNLTLDYYSVMLATKTLKRMAGGYLLKKIVEDTEKKVNNTLEPAERKLFLYAGHENNIAAILTVLGVWDYQDVPSYCSYVSIELHNINGTYGLQVYYLTNITTGPALIDIPDCGTFCPFDQFKNLIEDYISIDDTVCYLESSSTKMQSSFFLILLVICSYICC